jgi:phosphoribosyl-AMP cyclohydrolase
VGYRSCFYRKTVKNGDGAVHLERVETERVYDPDEVYGKS